MNDLEVPVTEITRRNIFDAMTLAGIHWAGRLDESDFLARLYDLKGMRSTDYRFGDAAGDIWQHRVRNRDWENDWVFTDRRFDLLRCPDAELLRFLCEMVHPIVRPDAEQVDRLVALFNEHLAADAWEIAPQTFVSNRPIFSACRRLLPDHAVAAVSAIATALSAEYISRQITRMQAATDPDLAIGTAKELVETVCKAILDEKGVPHDPAWEVSPLVKATTKALKLTPDDIPAAAKGAETIKILLSNLSSIAGRIAELRNLYGTGHGKSPSVEGLQPRHARLAVGAAATFVAFLFETHRDTR
jgi:hypothetical protein